MKNNNNKINKEEEKKIEEKKLTWGNIGNTPAVGVKEGRLLNLLRETKVYEFEVVVPIKQQVLRLQVAVHKVLPVTVLHRTHKLEEDLLGLTLLHLPPAHNVLKDFSSTRVLHHKVDVRVRRNHLIQLHNVRVPQVPPRLDLPVCQRTIRLVHDLHRHLLFRDGVNSQLHLAIRS